MVEPSIVAPVTDDINSEIKSLFLKVAEKKEEDLTEAELNELNEGVGAITELTKGLTDIALPGMELVAAELQEAKKKVNELQGFCQKLEDYQVAYSKKMAMALIEILDVIEGTKTASPTWRGNLRKQAGLE